MATVKPDHTAQRATHAAAVAQRLLDQKAKHDTAAAAKLLQQQTNTTNKANAAAAKQAAHLLAVQNRAAIVAANYQAKHPQLNYNGQAPTSINVTGGSTPGGATTGSDITPLGPGQTLQTGAGQGLVDSSDTTQPGVTSSDGNAMSTNAKPKPTQTFYQKHKTGVIVFAVVGGVIAVVGLYGYVKYRAITYPFRKAGKVLGIVKSAGRAVGGVIRS